MFAAGDPVSGSSLGVHVAAIEEDSGALLMRLDPDSPFADADGFVGYPNVDPVVESMNAMEAIRAYEANVSAIEATKAMIQSALEILG